MTRDQLIKYKFQAYQRIVFTNPRTNAETEMILVAVDFDTEQLKLVPLDVEYYEGTEYWYAAACCMPSRWLKTVKK